MQMLAFAYEHSRSVVVDDAQMLAFACTEHMEWIHEQVRSEYMQAMVKVYMHMCTIRLS